MFEALTPQVALWRVAWLLLANSSQDFICGGQAPIQHLTIFVGHSHPAVTNLFQYDCFHAKHLHIEVILPVRGGYAHALRLRQLAQQRVLLRVGKAATYMAAFFEATGCD